MKKNKKGARADLNVTFKGLDQSRSSINFTPLVPATRLTSKTIDYSHFNDLTDPDQDEAHGRNILGVSGTKALNQLLLEMTHNCSNDMNGKYYNLDWTHSLVSSTKVRKEIEQAQPDLSVNALEDNL